MLVVPACPILLVGQWFFEYVAHITGKYSGQSEHKKGLEAGNKQALNLTEIKYVTIGTALHGLVVSLCTLLSGITFKHCTLYLGSTQMCFFFFLWITEETATQHSMTVFYN